MFGELQNSVKRGLTYIHEHPQLVITLFLVLFIPVAFLVSGQQFLSAGRENQETLEKERIGILHDVLVSYIKATNFNATGIQTELEYLRKSNPDITKFNIAREEGATMRIVSSIHEDEVGMTIDNSEAYLTANVSPNASFITPYTENGVRYWQSFRLVKADGSPDHYIFTEVSLERIDSIFAERIREAYYWLLALLVVILYLLVRHVRLIDYAYLYQETKKANEMKDLFTNMIAHELRAPLTAMRGYASMIRERNGVDETSKKNAFEIESAAGRLVTIVSDLLDIARIQSGKMHIEKGEVHLSGLIRSVVEALHPTADEKGITLMIDDVLGTIEIKGDEKRLYQIFTNVLSNAIKYTKEGTVTLALTLSKDRVEVRVKDTGMGIGANDQQKMFAPFFRVEGKDTASITGTGLGLWVTKQLVELMGGSIGVESIKGIGTHVVITLPR